MQNGKKARRPHWLIVKDRISGMDVLTVDLGGEDALAVFGFEEEAQMFLELRPTASGEGWRARRTSAGELVSVLYGPCSGARRVALDPLPGVLDGGKSIGLLAIERKGFLRMVLGDEPSSLQLRASETLRPRKRMRYGQCRIVSPRTATNECEPCCELAISQAVPPQLAGLFFTIITIPTSL
jgi:hypothetical protein